MFWSNVKVALRNVRKNKFFATINILGLATGLTVFVFGSLLVNYEKSHDAFFKNSDNVYTLGTIVAPELKIGIPKINAVHSTMAPIIKVDLADVEHVARSMLQEYMVGIGDDRFYQFIRFVDPEFLNVFEFDYLHGDSNALQDPSGVLITESTAIRYFGKTNVAGEVITLDNQYDYHIAAVVRDLPANTHFNGVMVLEANFEVVMPIKALTRMDEFDENGVWDNLSMGNITYVQLPASLDGQWLQEQIDAMCDRVVPENMKEVIGGFYVVPLTAVNTAFWDSIGMPIIDVVSLLSLLVLVVACVNYTNLATAQSLGRSREVGMRKTMGAGQGQLLGQFLVESVVIAALAMIVAVALLELIIPLFNNASSKALAIDYLATLPWLLLTILGVGLFAGLYPAWLITRATPIDALRDTARKGKKGSRIRAVMIGVQFAISAFMLAIVAIVYMQNEMVKRSSYEFPRSEIYTLHRMNVEDIRSRWDTLRYELEALPNVDSVSYSFQVPYEQNNSSTNVATAPGDESNKISLQLLRMTPEFMDTYDIPILAGRNLSRDIAADKLDLEKESVNVLVNEMALEKLGFSSPAEAINQRFYDLDEEDAVKEFVIVGVVPTQNIVGLFNELKPWIYWYDDRYLRVASVRITGGNLMDTVEQIEDVWKRVIPDYPMQGRFLDEVFDDVYNILQLMNVALAGFAFIALTLALVGLFGLAAFMAAQRTKEIGVRKVLGANSWQIARLLVWQFSRPVMYALLVALPLAFLASQQYLNFFADRIQSQLPILLVAGVAAVVLAWGTVASHALRIAQANPVLALRYE
jgi:putative ABC transport system permease protein